MALLTKVEAAIALGISVELLESFVRKCPKPRGTRRLQATVVGGQELFEEDELHAFNKYLNEPWPRPPSGRRPTIPPEIVADIKRESHMACAICGHMDNGEVAHIEGVATTLNNSPSNLLLLCPNHHTKYDLGFKPDSNITPVEIKAAKLLKRNSRIRMLQAEASVIKKVQSLISQLKSIEEKLKTTAADSLTAEIYLTEAKNLLTAVSDLSAEAAVPRKTKNDKDVAKQLLIEKAPTLAKLSAGSFKKRSDAQVRSAVVGVVNVGRDLIIDLDEVACPHCGGRGTTGLVGDFCAYCRGSQVVSSAKAERYDPNDIDEVDCPHCGGSGQTGLAGDICSYCGGSQRISQAHVDEYDPDDIDEVDCPHCGGRGQTGLAGDICSYCGGSQKVSQAQSDEYDPDDIDEVDCPRCGGRGVTGLVGDFCSYCRGSQTVSRAQADEYYPDDIDEVPCPRCGGSGQTGLAGDICVLCKGAQSVTRAVAVAYRAKRKSDR